MERLPIGHISEKHRCIGSTNTRAKELAEQGAPHGMMILSDSQTQGRGRFDRIFYSPEGTGLYVSFILRPDLPPEKTALLTAMAGVAVSRAIEKTAPVETRIKWVNDILINRKKVCGILCEAHWDALSQRHTYAVLGIGVNVGKMAFPDELAGIASSIGNECGQDISRERLLAEICRELDTGLDRLADGSFIGEYRARQIAVGQNVTVLRGDERYPAKVLDVDENGNLVLETDQGVRTLGSGEISIRLST